MPFIPVPNVVEAEIRFLLDNQKIENTLYFHKSTSWDTASMEALGLALANWWETSIAPDVSSQVHMTEIHLSDLSDAAAGVADYIPPTPLGGGKGALPEPNSVAFVVKFLTGVRGRSGRGRNYIPGVCKGDVVANTLDPAVVSGWVAGYNALIGVATTAGCTWVVVSRFHNKAPRSGGVYYPVTSAAASDGRVDTQRRRLPGNGQ